MRYFIPVLLLTLAAASCKEDDSASCITAPAAQGITFRLVDNGGNDLLKGGRAGVAVDQPCRTTALEPEYRMYAITGSSDSATILSFANLATPEYGTGIAECYRIYFRFPGGDEDTVDWHYRLDGDANCKQPSIDYMSYNGLQAARESAFGRNYYRLVKR